MCIPIGQSDVMSVGEQAAYKQAVGEPLSIPPAAPVITRDDTYQAPKGATIRLADGRMVTQDSFAKLQQKLKNRR